MANASDLDAVARHLARNQQLLEVLARHNADRAVRRTIDFFFYTSSHQDGRHLARALRSAGFCTVSLAEQARDGSWLLQAALIGTIDDVTKERFVSNLVRLAAEHAAEFDGWGTSV